MKTINKLLVLPLFMTIAIGAVACKGKQSIAEEPSPVVEKDSVKFPSGSPQVKNLASIVVDDARSEILRLNARLVWDEERTVRVYAPMAGRVVKLLVQPGQTVKVGESLALVSSPDFGQAQAEERRAEAEFAVAEKSLLRSRELLQHGVIAAKEMQQAEADHVKAMAELDRTRARSRLYGGRRAVDQQLPLKAPIAGTVVERNANPGQEIRPDQAQPGNPALFVISDPSRLWVQIELTEAALAQVKPGMAFALKGPSIGGEQVEGSVEWISDTIDPATRTTRARGRVENQDRRLKAEMFVVAEIELVQDKFLKVPSVAIVLLGDKQYVFVEEGEGRYLRRRVVAEEAGFGRMIVRQGLERGERVVSDGALLLQQMITLKAK